AQCVRMLASTGRSSNLMVSIACGRASMLLKLINAAFGIAAALLLVTGPAAAQTLDKIKQRGVLAVGSKADYKPFGFRDPAGNIVGFEPDLGRDGAEGLAGKPGPRPGGP